MSATGFKGRGNGPRRYISVALLWSQPPAMRRAQSA